MQCTLSGYIQFQAAVYSSLIQMTKQIEYPGVDYSLYTHEPLLTSSTANTDDEPLV